jgi:hypothetical protein
MPPKGSLVRQDAATIAARRREVRRLHLFGEPPIRILKAIQEQMPTLIEGQAEPYDQIIADLRGIRDDQVAALQAGIGIEGLALYVDGLIELMRMAIADHNNPALGDMAKIKALALAVECRRNIARAQGVPVDSPALQLNITQMLALAGVDTASLGLLLPSPEGAGASSATMGGIVDPLTFATDHRFCGLANIADSFPMQYEVLTKFMSPLAAYTILVLVCGMRSGKGVVGSVCAWYGAYELLSLADPQAYYGLAPNQEIQILNMATAERQAKNNVFKHILDRLNTGGVWFQTIRDQATVTGLEIRLPKNIVIRCGHSKATTQVGGTSYMVILDELARFKDTEGHDNADDVWDKMRATTATFKDSARMLVLTSPEWEGDKSMRLLNDALEFDADDQPTHPNMLGLQLATWEANLNFTQGGLWKTQNASDNPRAFWRDFGARPPHSAEGYYPDPERWDRQPDTERPGHPYDDSGRLAEWFRPCCPAKRFVHVDLGAKRDACGIAMAHKPVPGCPYFATKEGEPNPRAKRIVVDVVLQIKPPPAREEKGEISFERVRQLIRDWQDRGFKIKAGLVSYDGWQSYDSKQILKREGFKVREFSLDRDTIGHDTLQELINGDHLSFYPYPVLQKEGKALDLIRGKKVDHPKGGSKDVIDAVAGAVYHALKGGGRITFVG